MRVGHAAASTFVTGRGGYRPYSLNSIEEMIQYLEDTGEIGMLSGFPRNWTIGAAARGAPILETRSCHYQRSIDPQLHRGSAPGVANVLLAGGGSSEGFKFGPAVGEYIARRALGLKDDPALGEQFRLKEKEEEFENEPSSNGGA